MPSSPSANRAPHCLCRGRSLRRALLVSFVITPSLFAQQKPTPKPAAPHRANEFTLAGLRPGLDSVGKAKRLYKSFSDPAKDHGEIVWEEACRKSSLILSYDDREKIQTIRVSEMKGSIDADCLAKSETAAWRTGHGLAVKDSTARIVQLYGPPDSKSPSTRDGQPLELWYYAFDWAGPDVPQVMEVLCTREQDGKPGRVVEITLAAPSL